MKSIMQKFVTTAESLIRFDEAKWDVRFGRAENVFISFNNNLYANFHTEKGKFTQHMHVSRVLTLECQTSNSDI